MKIDLMNGEMLNRAIAIYMSHAYRGSETASQKMPVFRDGLPLDDILKEGSRFEDLTGGTPPTLAANPVPTSGGSAPRVYALRLGNSSYPHMKLAIVEAYFANEFVFAVDRHDTFHFEPDLPGYAAWCELKEINRLIKESIEDAWHKDGVPTLRGLRERRFKRPDLVREMNMENQAVLMLDDDEHRADLVKRMLEGEGYRVLVGPPGPRPLPRHATKNTAVMQNADKVDELCALMKENHVAMVVMDVSYRTGQGPRVANALRLDVLTQDVPILAIYSRRDFGPDPDLFDASIRRPYREEQLKTLVAQTLMKKGRGGSGIHPAVP